MYTKKVTTRDARGCCICRSWEIFACLRETSLIYHDVHLVFKSIGMNKKYPLDSFHFDNKILFLHKSLFSFPLFPLPLSLSLANFLTYFVCYCCWCCLHSIEIESDRIAIMSFRCFTKIRSRSRNVENCVCRMCDRWTETRERKIWIKKTTYHIINYILYTGCNVFAFFWSN